MNLRSREEIIGELRKKISEGKFLVGVGAGNGMTAKWAEAGGADLITVYNSGRFRMAGRGSLSGYLAYGDANKIVQDMGTEVLTVTEDIPVLAGVCGTDPFRVMRLFLNDLKKQGFSGVQNFPTVGLIDGNFRANLEATGMGYALEVDMIRAAHEIDMLTCPYVFNPKEAAQMANAGADIIVAHMGLTTKGSIGASVAYTLEECRERLEKIIAAAREVNPEIIVFCHGGPISEPEDAQYIAEKVPGINGFFGASSIERLACESAIKEKTEKFKSIKRD